MLRGILLASRSRCSRRLLRRGRWRRGPVGLGCRRRVARSPAGGRRLGVHAVRPRASSAGSTSARRGTTRTGFGRQGGWKARFSRTGTRETEGALVVASLADLFDSADDAGEDFELYKASLDQFTAAGGRPVPVSGLGDEAYAVRFEPGDRAERDPPLRDRLARRRRDGLGDRQRLPPDVAPGACVSARAARPHQLCRGLTSGKAFVKCRYHPL